MNPQAMFPAAGIQAAHIERLWWILAAVAAVVQAAVLIALIAAVLRRRTAASRETSDRSLTRGVAGATVISAAALVGLVAASAITGRALAGLETEDRIVIDITGRQWWWDVEYEHPDPSMRVRMANELRIPVGRAVQVRLRSADVVHSFWVPALHGKQDLVPGHANDIWLRADAPGTYRGQCAEFCGYQHAHMALLIVAVPADDFNRWLAGQREATRPAATPRAARGRDIIERGPCGACHNVRGTDAGGRVGPDLTHVATRQTIAAGTLPNTADNLARWISDPQQYKPGSRMPALGLAPDDIQAVIAYLRGTP